MVAFDTERLKAARKRRFKNQDLFASAVGFSKVKVARFESGMTIPDLEDLEKIANVLGVRRSFLLGEMSEDDDKPTEEERHFEAEIMMARAKDFSSYYASMEHIRAYADHLSKSDITLLSAMISNIQERLGEALKAFDTKQ